MGKPTICIGENKGADQLRGNCEADQRLCFRYSDSTIPLLLIQNFKLLALFCDCTGRFVSDLFGNTLLVFPRGGSFVYFLNLETSMKTTLFGKIILPISESIFDVVAGSVDKYPALIPGSTLYTDILVYITQVL